MYKEISCYIFRGGTSKGVFLRADDLPKDRHTLDRLLLKLMGSPEIRQIDGLGGATSTTSKVAILSKSSRLNVDIDYTFAQVAVGKAIVNYNSNCGNISAAVGPCALEMGLVSKEQGETHIRILNTNSGKIIHSRVLSSKKSVVYPSPLDLDFKNVRLRFIDPQGTINDSLFPTGNKRDEFILSGGKKVRVSVIDAATPVIFLKARDFGFYSMNQLMEGVEDILFLKEMEELRGVVAHSMGLVANPNLASEDSPTIPKVSLIMEGHEYRNKKGKLIKGDRLHLCACMLSMQKPHPAYAITGAVATACGAQVYDTLVNQLIKKPLNGTLVIGNPNGLIEMHLGEIEEGAFVEILTSTRKILKGTAYL